MDTLISIRRPEAGIIPFWPVMTDIAAIFTVGTTVSIALPVIDALMDLY